MEISNLPSSHQLDGDATKSLLDYGNDYATDHSPYSIRKPNDLPLTTKRMTIQEHFPTSIPAAISRDEHDQLVAPKDHPSDQLLPMTTKFPSGSMVSMSPLDMGVATKDLELADMSELSNSRYNQLDISTAISLSPVEKDSVVVTNEEYQMDSLADIFRPQHLSPSKDERSNTQSHDNLNETTSTRDDISALNFQRNDASTSPPTFSTAVQEDIYKPSNTRVESKNSSSVSFITANNHSDNQDALSVANSHTSVSQYFKAQSSLVRSPYTTLRQNSMHVAMEEGKAYVAKIHDLQEALTDAEAEKGRVQGEYEQQIQILTHRLQEQQQEEDSKTRSNASASLPDTTQDNGNSTTSSKNTFATAVHSPMSTLAANLGTSMDSTVVSPTEKGQQLLERNQTLLKELRFADQTCVELAGKSAALEREVQQRDKLNQELLHSQEAWQKEMMASYKSCVQLETDRNLLHEELKTTVQRHEAYKKTMEEKLEEALQTIKSNKEEMERVKEIHAKEQTQMEELLLQKSTSLEHLQNQILQSHDDLLAQSTTNSKLVHEREILHTQVKELMQQCELHNKREHELQRKLNQFSQDLRIAHMEEAKLQLENKQLSAAAQGMEKINSELVAQEQENSNELERSQKNVDVLSQQVRNERNRRQSLEVSLEKIKSERNIEMKHNGSSTRDHENKVDSSVPERHTSSENILTATKLLEKSSESQRAYEEAEKLLLSKAKKYFLDTRASVLSLKSKFDRLRNRTQTPNGQGQILFQQEKQQVWNPTLNKAYGYILGVSESNLRLLDKKISERVLLYENRIAQLSRLVRHLSSSLEFEPSVSADHDSRNGSGDHSVNTLQKDAPEKGVLDATFAVLHSVSDEDVNIMEEARSIKGTLPTASIQLDLSHIEAFSPTHHSNESSLSPTSPNSLVQDYLKDSRIVQNNTGDTLSTAKQQIVVSVKETEEINSLMEDLNLLTKSLSSFEQEFSAQIGGMNSFVDVQKMLVTRAQESLKTNASDEEEISNTSISASFNSSSKALARRNTARQSSSFPLDKKEAGETLEGGGMKDSPPNRSMEENALSNLNSVVWPSDKSPEVLRRADETGNGKLSHLDVEELRASFEKQVMERDVAVKTEYNLRLNVERELEETRSHVSQARSRLIEANEEMESLRENFLLCNDKLAELEKTNSMLQDRVVELGADLAIATTEKTNELKAQLQKIQTERDSLKLRCASYKEEVHQMEQKIEIDVASIRELQDIVKLEEAQRQQAEQQLAVVTTELSETQSKLQASLDLEVQLVSCKNELQEKEKKLESDEKLIEELQDSVNIESTVKLQVEQQLENARAEIAKVKEELNSVSLKVVSLEEEKKKAELKLVGQVQLTEFREASANGMVASLKSERDKLKDHMDKVVEAMEREIVGKDAELNKIRVEASQLQAKLGTYNRSGETSNSEIHRLHELLQQSSNSFEALKRSYVSCNDKLAKLEDSNSLNEVQVEELRAVLRKVDDDFKFMNEKNVAIESIVPNVLHGLASVNTEVNSAWQELKDMKSEMENDLKTKHVKLMKAYKENDELRHQVTGVTSQIHHLRTALANRQLEIDSLSQEVEQKDGEIIALKEACEAAESLTSHTEKQLLENRQQLENSRKRHAFLVGKVKQAEEASRKSQLHFAEYQRETTMASSTLRKERDQTKSDFEAWKSALMLDLYSQRMELLSSLASVGCCVGDESTENSHFRGRTDDIDIELSCWKELTIALRASVLACFSTVESLNRNQRMLQEKVNEFHVQKEELRATLAEERDVCKSLQLQLREAQMKLESFARQEENSESLEKYKLELNQKRVEEVRYYEDMLRQKDEDLRNAKVELRNFENSLHVLSRELSAASQEVAHVKSLESDNMETMSRKEREYITLNEEKLTYERKYIRLKAYVRKLTSKCEEWEISFQKQNTVFQRLQSQAARSAQSVQRINDGLPSPLHPENFFSPKSEAQTRLNEEIKQTATELSSVPWI